MPEQRDVKVFISWSGDLAKAVAVALREWLPILFDRVAPWTSDADIAAGQRGLSQIEAELGGTQFGIVVVTSQNQHAPWLNFEAGALSKTIDGEIEQRVVPLLVDLTGPTQLTGPLSQFQAKLANKEGTLSLLRSLGAVAGIEEHVVNQRFEAYWPQLEAKVGEAIAATSKGKPKQKPRDPADVLDEILLHVRALRSDGESNAGTKSEQRPRQKGTTLGEYLTREARDLGLEVIEHKHENGKIEVVVCPASGYEPSTSASEEFEAKVKRDLKPPVSVTYVPF